MALNCSFSYTATHYTAEKLLPDKDSSYKECRHLTQAGKDHSSYGFRVSPSQILNWD